MITAKMQDTTLILEAAGRIDSGNAAEHETQIQTAREQNPHEAVILDFDGLEYISSAGLRVVLRLRKDEPTLRVVNVCSEVYEIFEMTGFTEMLPVEKAYRKLSVDGCAVIGKGAKGTVYRYNPDTIVKVYHNPDSLPDIHRERELARKAFVLGIPTAISYDVVKVGESYGSVFELLDAKSYSQIIAENPDKLDEYVKAYADLLVQIHHTPVKEEDMPDIKDTIRKWMDAAAPQLDPAVAKKVAALIEAVPDTMNMLHCDYHTNNIMMQNGETLLIDMDTLAHGHPIFELANVHITYVGFGAVDPGIVEKFIGLPFATAVKIWEKFLPDYLGTDDPARLKEVEEKVELLSYLRLMRHTLRRGGLDTEDGRKTVALCSEKIAALTEKVDTLEF